MKATSQYNAERLYRTAEAQCGHFTTKQAKAAGYTENNFQHHIRKGHWIREYRGIYRLNRFPASENSQLVLWSLWSCDRSGIPQAVYSHETALRIYELSGIMPTRLHMTVPMRFRRSADLPPVLALHRASLSPDDVEEMQGFRATRPLRALLDLVAARTVSPDMLEQALREGLARGLITRNAIRACRHPEEGMATIREYLARMQG